MDKAIKILEEQKKKYEDDIEMMDEKMGQNDSYPSHTYHDLKQSLSEINDALRLLKLNKVNVIKKGKISRIEYITETEAKMDLDKFINGIVFHYTKEHLEKLHNAEIMV